MSECIKDNGTLFYFTHQFSPCQSLEISLDSLIENDVASKLMNFALFSISIFHNPNTIFVMIGAQTECKKKTTAGNKNMVLIK